MNVDEKGSVGSSFDDFLEEEGIIDEVTEIAAKKVLAAAIEQEMKSKNITKVSMAEMMRTSRAQVNRLLDPDNNGVTLQTMQRAAQVLGRRIRIEFV